MQMVVLKCPKEGCLGKVPVPDVQPYTPRATCCPDCGLSIFYTWTPEEVKLELNGEAHESLCGLYL